MNAIGSSMRWESESECVREKLIQKVSRENNVVSFMSGIEFAAPSTGINWQLTLTWGREKNDENLWEKWKIPK